MVDLSLISILVFKPAFQHLFAIFSAFIITYFSVLGKDFFWLIDDDGIFRYQEQFIPEHEEEQIVKGVKQKYWIPEEKVDSYVIGEGTSRKRVKFLKFIPELGFPGSVLRFLRLQIGKKFCELGKNQKGHSVYGYRQSPVRHHLLSITVQILNLTLGYFLLSKLFNSNLAFAACLLFSVYPLTTQLVAWISGLMYSLALLFSLLTLNTSLYLHDFHWIIPLTVLFSFISGLSLYYGCFTFLILWFLGFKWAAFSSGMIGIFVLFWKGNETKRYRIVHFKEQNMGGTTFFELRRPIFMVKTFAYYLPFVFFPIRMGLYHVFGYFFDEKTQRIDKLFWAGIAALGLVVFSFIYGDFSIRFGIVWFLSYYFLFSNFIIAQQTVGDRYMAAPSFGICLILARLLYPTPFFWILFGLYAMRTFMHLPTFRNEVDFYISNWLNFRKSEVALGNLGVAYMNQQMPGAAVDSWMLASKINPQYDVAWYNLYSIFKSSGRLGEARGFLKKCVDSKVVHFKDRWEKELQELDSVIEQSKMPETQCDKWFNEAKMYYDSGNLIKEAECLKKIIDMPTNGVLPHFMEGINQRYAELKLIKGTT